MKNNEFIGGRVGMVAFSEPGSGRCKNGGFWGFLGFKIGKIAGSVQDD